MTELNLSDVLTEIPDADDAELVADRKREGAVATPETLREELSVVADRHKGPLGPSHIAREAIGFGDAYASMNDVRVELLPVETPDGEPLILVDFPDHDIIPAPVGGMMPDDEEARRIKDELQGSGYSIV